MYWTVMGTALAVIGFVYGFLSARIDSIEERISLLTTGKTLKEAMMEAKKFKDK